MQFGAARESAGFPPAASLWEGLRRIERNNPVKKHKLIKQEQVRWRTNYLMKQV